MSFTTSIAEPRMSTLAPVRRRAGGRSMRIMWVVGEARWSQKARTEPAMPAPEMRTFGGEAWGGVGEWGVGKEWGSGGWWSLGGWSAGARTYTTCMKLRTLGTLLV